MDIHIPPAALEAGARAVEDRINQPGQCSYQDMTRAAFVAMVEAWSNATVDELTPGDEPFLILPLTEKQDDKA